MFSSIVVGTDGSSTAQEAVRQAVDLAKTHGAVLKIVTAYEPVPDARLRAEKAAAPDDLEWTFNPHEDVDAMLGEIARQVESAGVRTQTFARTGDPSEALLDVAEAEAADLIVVGNKGMTGAKRFILGSVPNNISHHANCSVLIVHTT